MQAKCGLIKSRVFSWLTLIVFSVFSVMPFPGYAATDWEAVVTEEGTLKTRLDDSGNREWMTEGNTRVNVGSFNQSLGETWNFKLGGGDLMVNVNGGERTVWSGTTNVFDGILGLFNLNGVHFTDTSRINLTNAGFIGAAMRAVDGSGFSQLKLQGNGYVLNEGQMRGGEIALLGGAVENRGIIEAPLNQITLAGGKAMTVGLSPDNLISVVVDELTDTKVKNFAGTDLDDQIKNSGNITGHKIKLDAKGVDSVFEKAINLTGEIKAVDVDEVDGELVMMSMDDIYSKAILDAARIHIRTEGDIHMMGVTRARELNEQGASFQIGGQYHVERGSHDNADHAITYAADTEVSGTIEDDENIVIDENVTVTLTGHTSLIADASSGTDGIADNEQDGTGAILMNEGSKIVGSGFNLTLAGSGESIVREITGVGDLTLNARTAGAEFTLRRGVDINGDLTINSSATLTGTYSMTVRGGSVTGDGDINLTGGTFTVLGDGNFGGSQDWNFNQLVFGDGETAATTQKTGDNDITIAQDWTINELHTLRGGASTWDVAWGSGTMQDIIQIVSGAYHTLALSSLDGSVYAWGQGPLGDGTSSARLSPIRVLGIGSDDYLTGVQSLAAGSGFSLAVLEDGTVAAWGDNYYGQLGDGTETDRLRPVKVLASDGESDLENVTAVTAGDNFSLALLESKNVMSWGYGASGTLGDNTTDARALPDFVHGIDGEGILSGVSAIDAGSGHVLALMETGEVVAWGENGIGALGTGDDDARLVPVYVRGLDDEEILSGVTAVSAGTAFSLAILDDGRVASWGSNFRGQLGDGTTDDRLLPGLVADSDGIGFLSNVKAVSAGSYHAAAIVGDERMVFSWGDNSSGQLGIGTDDDSLLPTAALDIDGETFLTDVDSISSGNYHTIALRSTGSPIGWGGNFYGQLGTGTTLSQSVAVETLSRIDLAVNRLTNIIAISAGYYHNLALSSIDGAVYAWGRNTSGQLGDGSTSDRYAPVRVRGINNEGYLQGVKAIAAGGDFSAAVMEEDGSVVAWGGNYNGQLGDGTDDNQKTAPVRVLGLEGEGYLEGIVSIAAGYAHVLAVSEDQNVYAWGANGNGQLGINSTTDSLLPVLVHDTDGDGFLENVISVAAGEAHSLALFENGTTMAAWGRNVYGQLGDSSTSASLTPVNVKGVGGVGLLSNIIAISAHIDHSMALLADGSVVGWGLNLSYQIGDGTRTARTAPVYVKGSGGIGNLSGISRIAAGDDHSFALTSDGNVVGWGRNFSGQLGDGGLSFQSIYAASVVDLDETGSLANVAEIASGKDHGMALLSDGSLALWGSNDYGQIGNNTTGMSYVPIQAGTLVFEPFVENGTFEAENSTVSYSGDIQIGGQQITTQIADTQYNNLELQNRAADYGLRGIPATEDELKKITDGSLTVHGETRKTPVIDMSHVIQVDPRERMLEIINLFGGDKTATHDFLKMLFGGGHEMRQVNLKTGMNEFNVDPSAMGFDRGMDQFREAVFGAQAESLNQRVMLNQTLKTGTVIQNVTGAVRIIDKDGTIYEAKEGSELQEGDQVVTDKAAKVELSKGKDQVTVSEGSAVQVQKQNEAGKPVQDLLTLAFGKVSVAVSDDSHSSFVIQTPNGISGTRA